MKPKDVSEAQLAWRIWQMLEELNGLLWTRYEDQFLSFAMEEEEQDWLSTIRQETKESGHNNNTQDHAKNQVNPI